MTLDEVIRQTSLAQISLGYAVRRLLAEDEVVAEKHFREAQELLESVHAHFNPDALGPCSPR